MKSVRTVRSMALALALTVTGVGTAAWAQHEESGHEEAAHEALHEGFHQPPGINLAHYPPPMETVSHEGHTVQQPGPPPFIGPLVNFAILAFLGYMAVKRSINPSLAARRTAMETEIAEARRLHTEAKAMHAEYTARLAKLDAEVDTLRAEFTRAGEAERDRIITEARARAERMRTEGTQAIEQEFKSLRDDLTREVVLAATAAAEDSVRKSITAADHARLADAYLVDLTAQSTAGARA